MQTTIRTTIAAITLAFSLPMIAHAKPANREGHWTLYDRAPSWIEARCTRPYGNQFPPCMATWPESDPHFTGGRTGVTFTR